MVLPKEQILFVFCINDITSSIQVTNICIFINDALFYVNGRAIDKLFAILYEDLNDGVRPKFCFRFRPINLGFGSKSSRNFGLSRNYVY